MLPFPLSTTKFRTSSPTIMVNYTVMMLLLVMTVFCVIPGPEAQDHSCGYAQCIFEGQTGSITDKVLVQHNFADIPVDIISKCSALQQRIYNCSGFKFNCPPWVRQPWDNRLTDDRYVIYLMGLGHWACTANGPEKLVNLRVCTDSKTHDQMQKCFTGPNFLNAECAFYKFLTNSWCSKDTDEFVRNLIDRLIQNPYYII